MSLFRRGSHGAEDDGALAETEQVEDMELDDEMAVTPRDRGPWDVSEMSEIGSRIDLGAMWLPARDGMELRMEIEQATQRVTAAAIALHGSNLQLQVFAAPRTEGIWDEVRVEIAASVTKQGGTVDDLPGPFGRELLSRLPVRTEGGRTGHRAARFIGYNGPRWFLRGVLTGSAAVDPVAAEELEAVFADVVVLRGGEPRAPRDLLDLHLPGQTPSLSRMPERTGDVPTRGPEMTETR